MATTGRPCGRKVLLPGWMAHLTRARPGCRPCIPRMRWHIGVVKCSRAPAQLQTPFQRHHLVARVRHRPAGDRPRSTGAAGRVLAGPGASARVAGRSSSLLRIGSPSGASSKVPHLDPATGAPVLRWQHRTAVLLFRGRFFCYQNHYPQKHRSTPLAAFQDANVRSPSFGGFGLRHSGNLYLAHRGIPLAVV